MHSGGGEKGAFGFGFWVEGGEEEEEDGGISRTIGVGALSLPPFSSCFVAVSNLPPLPPPFAAIVVGCMGRRGEECLGKTESKTFTKVLTFITYRTRSLMY